MKAFPFTPEQCEPKLGFKLLDLPAERRLRDRKLRGRATDILQFRHADKVAQSPQIKHQT